MSAVLEAREPGARYLDAVQLSSVKHFDLLATASGNVGRLRELILTLAVQGKLLPQDPNDEPATELLDLINAEKSRMATAGRVQRQRPSPDVQVPEEPFELPLGWTWVRLPQISYDLGQTAPTQAFTYIDVAAIDNERAVITDAVEVVQPADAPSRARKRVSVGTVIYSTVRPYLKNIATVEKAYAPSAIASTAFAVMHPHTGVNARYLLTYLRSAVFTEFVASKMAGIAYPAINDSCFFSGIVALPPTAEQARIVARVDELMRLCDALEAHGRLEAEQHARLLGTLLGTLTDSSTPEELAANWQRVADHFDLLLDRPEAVDALEQTILELAVRGLLVSQTTNDPSVNNLETGGQRAILCGWRRSRIGDVVAMLNGYAFKSDSFTASGTRLVRNANVAHGHIDWKQAAYVSPEVADEFAQFALAEGDLVLTLDRPIISTGLKLALIRAHDLPCLLLQRVARLSPDATLLSRDFLMLWLRSNFFVKAIDPGRSNGVPHISTKEVAALTIDYPPLALQAQIVARVTELRRLCTDLRHRLLAIRTTQSRLADALVDEVA